MNVYPVCVYRCLFNLRSTYVLRTEKQAIQKCMIYSLHLRKGNMADVEPTGCRRTQNNQGFDHLKDFKQENESKRNHPFSILQTYMLCTYKYLPDSQSHISMQFNKSTYIVLGKNVRKFEFAIVPVYDFSQTVSAYKLLLQQFYCTKGCCRLHQRKLCG